MKVDYIDFTTRAAASLTDADGIRDGTAAVAVNLTQALSATFTFIARSRQDSDVAEVLAAAGLGASDFQRLETRISNSRLWQTHRSSSASVIGNLGEDPVLKFLAFGTGTTKLIAVPISLRGSTVGLVSVGFAAAASVNDNEIIKFLRVIAALIAQTMRVERATADESRRLTEENIHLKQELREKYDLSQLIGNSNPMRVVYDQVSQVARSNATILLRGESGTGKELIANAIHYNSLRSKRPFVKVNCAAVPETLVESELFGHEPGAFAGAGKRRMGRFEAAEGGTLFLDEVGELARETQVKLLRVIQEREFERLGGIETIRSNVRLIAASSLDLEDAIADGTFSEDLFDRMQAFTIFLPPLRERKSDILLLADHFLEKYSAQHDKAILRISTPAIDMLTAYHFPGNVRELENTIERAVVACDANVIHGRHLPPTLQTAEGSGTETRVTLASTVEAFEKDLIQDALKSTRGNITRAAKMLHSTERILGYKINKYGIDTIRFRK